MRTSLSSKLTALVAVFGVSALALNAPAATSTFTGSVDNDYGTGANWSPSGVPNTGGGDTALINNGSAVTYNAGPDLFLGNGGTLEIRSGSWEQINGPAYIQMSGSGHVLVNGGTFNQGTSTSNPFNVGSSTGNTFTITSGAAIFTKVVNAVAGITYNIAGGSTTMSAGPLVVQSGGKVYISSGSLLIGGAVSLENGSVWEQSGGTVTLTNNGEFDYSSLSGGLMSGGTLNVPKLLTGVNGAVGSTFDFAGGIINIGGSAFNGWYGADNANHPFNFTLGSTGVINFLNGNTSIANVNDWLAAGGIQYNDTISPSAFSVTQNGSTVTLTLAVPEPATGALMVAGLGGLIAFRRRRQS